MMEKEEFLFPYEEVRQIQDKLLHKVDEVLKKKKHLIVHAPTGLGKTAATLAPALAFAMKNNLTVFFLTSRHTQHLIVIETLKKIKETFDTKFIVTDIIGKKWMCPVEGTDTLYSSEFYDYCKKQREDNLCEFYENTKAKGKLSEKAKHVLKQIEQLQPCDSEKVVELCTENKLCPYEISMALATKSHVIIGDYHHIFHPSISQTFLAKIGKNLDESIIIIDEGHNLPLRVRDLASDKLSSFILNRALKEAKKMGFNETKDNIEGVQAVLEELSLGVEIGSEKKIKQKDFVDRINDYKEYETMAADLEFVGDDIRKMQKQSFVGAVAKFMEIWQQDDEGFTRIISKTASKYGDNINLDYRCLDPSLLTKDVIKASYITILMSGTLTPTTMYQELLGFPENTEEESYESPFPDENRLNLVVPITTTKFTSRSTGQYMEIAKICAEIVNCVPGNSAVFFPSYKLRDSVYSFFCSQTKKKLIIETSGMSKQEKKELLEDFKKHKKEGAVLLAVAAGSYGESIDLPGDLLKAVIVVGLPLQKPDLETRELINYYDMKFSRGWDYGYLFPAFNKCLQNAGRCIRSKDDRGIVVFLDERFTWRNYARCFPEDMEIKVTEKYKEIIDYFFAEY